MLKKIACTIFPEGMDGFFQTYLNIEFDNHC